MSLKLWKFEGKHKINKCQTVSLVFSCGRPSMLRGQTMRAQNLIKKLIQINLFILKISYLLIIMQAVNI